MLKNSQISPKSNGIAECLVYSIQSTPLQSAIFNVAFNVTYFAEIEISKDRLIYRTLPNSDYGVGEQQYMNAISPIPLFWA